MITNAFIYKRTLTRPAMYYLFVILLDYGAETLIAVCRINLSLKKVSAITMNATSKCPLPQTLIADSPLPVPVDADSPLPEPLEADCPVNTTLEAVSKVVK